MKKLLLALFLLAAGSADAQVFNVREWKTKAPTVATATTMVYSGPSQAQPAPVLRYSPSRVISSTPAPVQPQTKSAVVNVKAHTKKDGTQVSAHTRSAPKRKK